MTKNPSFSLTTMRNAVEETLHSLNSWLDEACVEEMTAMIDHHFGWNQNGQGGTGKRVRPLLTLLCCEAAGGQWRDALPAAAAIETIHNFSLVHDDIQDQSESRRGRPTLWAVWGTAQSINTGDSLFVLAHLFLDRLQREFSSPETILAARQILNDACLELTIGQHLDLAFETRKSISIEEYYRMIKGKTASLLAASCEIGAVIAGAHKNKSQHFYNFGFHLGMAFQLLDDILGIWGDTGKTGKPAGADIFSRKKTLPVVLGLRDSPPFSEIWSKATLTEDDLDKMILALDTAGVSGTTLEEAQNHTTKALRSLSDSEGVKQGTDALSKLAKDLLERKH